MHTVRPGQDDIAQIRGAEPEADRRAFRPPAECECLFVERGHIVAADHDRVDAAGIPRARGRANRFLSDACETHEADTASLGLGSAPFFEAGLRFTRQLPVDQFARVDLARARQPPPPGEAEQARRRLELGDRHESFGPGFDAVFGGRLRLRQTGKKQTRAGDQQPAQPG